MDAVFVPTECYTFVCYRLLRFFKGRNAVLCLVCKRKRLFATILSHAIRSQNSQKLDMAPNRTRVRVRVVLFGTRAAYWDLGCIQESLKYLFFFFFA